MEREAAESFGIRLVERAHLAEALAKGVVVGEIDAALREHVVELLAALGRQAVGSVGDGAEVEDLREVNERVARHGEGELGLARLKAARHRR